MIFSVIFAQPRCRPDINDESIVNLLVQTGAQDAVPGDEVSIPIHCLGDYHPHHYYYCFLQLLQQQRQARHRLPPIQPPHRLVYPNVPMVLPMMIPLGCSWYYVWLVMIWKFEPVMGEGRPLLFK